MARVIELKEGEELPEKCPECNESMSTIEENIVKCHFCALVFEKPA